MTEVVLEEVEVLWDYLCLRHPLEKADLILVLGSYDLRSAAHGAALYQQGWASKLMFSGGLGNFTSGIFSQPEADLFADHARKLGVPSEDILIENQSTNSGENLQFSRTLLQERLIPHQRIILVHKPNMLRRVLATFAKQWPGPRYICSAADLTFKDIPHHHMTPEKVICEMVGDFQRILEYPALGFQIPQEVPDNVLSAYHFLKNSGYNKHCLS